jgi:hypothetical protein
MGDWELIILLILPIDKLLGLCYNENIGPGARGGPTEKVK